MSQYSTPSPDKENSEASQVSTPKHLPVARRLFCEVQTQEPASENQSVSTPVGTPPSSPPQKFVSSEKKSAGRRSVSGGGRVTRRNRKRRRSEFTGSRLFAFDEAEEPQPVSHTKPKTPSFVGNEPDSPAQRTLSSPCVDTPPKAKIRRVESDEETPQCVKKVVYCVRHGESMYNRYGDKWEGTRDAPLTELGVEQSKRAKEVLQEKLAGKSAEDVLFLVSPLTRAIETFQHSCPFENPIVEFCPSLAERCKTIGDIGRPESELIKEFPEFKEELEGLGEKWWYGANEKVQRHNESRAVFKERVFIFRTRLQRRKDQVVVVVGHSVCIRELQNTSSCLGNGEVGTWNF